MFTLLRSEGLNISFDPVETEDKHYPSVAFDLVVEWATSFNQARIKIKKFWVAYYDLRQFEKDLREFVEERRDRVELHDMSPEPVLSFSRAGADIFFELKTEPGYRPGVLTLKTELEPDDAAAMLRNLRDWAKWW
ncbi:MAG: hypothetical protein JSS81_09900 [Acidobacteria bacterium]|nr:hypothetical protein [Acidobacteriota bacterium]